MNSKKPIGRIIATEKNPTTMDSFSFWTDASLKLHAFDIVKVEHVEGSWSYGVIENISHLTDAQSFLTSFISNDFGDVEINAPTIRVGMNRVEAKITFNSHNIYTPVHNNKPVYLASKDEITSALGLEDIQNPLVCGYLIMYEDSKDAVTLPVNLNSQFILGPEGAHLNISGISGLASKTSYAMFLMKAIQERCMSNKAGNDSVAFVVFNVKGKDLMAIHKPNEFKGKDEGPEEAKRVKEEYKKLNLSAKPFKNVKYFIPYTAPNSSVMGTYLSKEDVEEYCADKILNKYKYTYEDDKESIEMLFADIEDPNQTMESILNKIIDDSDPDFGNNQVNTWEGLREKVDEFSQKSDASKKNKVSNEISVLSWKKFKRIINKAIKNDSMFANRAEKTNGECRLAESIINIKPNDVMVIDIAKLPEEKQAFVFGDAIRTIYNLKLGEYDDDVDVKTVPSRIVVFIDELNKYASKETPKSSPILREILDVTERGRSLGVVLFGAEQFRSNIHKRVTGNCATHAYGRTNSIETATPDYSSLPSTYKNILTRLKQGYYIIQNPVFRSLLKVKFPKPIYKQFK